MRSPAKPAVSIIIPTHNSGETIAECLRSIKSQSYADCEIIIVDDFSSDNTTETAKMFQARTIQRKCNPALARNIGIADSVSDSDQVLAPSVIEQCVRKCEHEQVGMVRIPEISVGKGFWDSCSAAWKNSHQLVERLHGEKVTVFSGEPRFFVRELVAQVGMFNTKLVWGEDYDLYEKGRYQGSYVPLLHLSL
jgi:glycosyltransferase involved in cell wall biosynthesis